MAVGPLSVPPAPGLPPAHGLLPAPLSVITAPCCAPPVVTTTEFAGPADVNSPARAELLEDRMLLAVTGVLVGSELTVFADGGEDLTVLHNTTTGNLEVQLGDGSTATSIPDVDASTLTVLNVFTEAGDNGIDRTTLAATLIGNSGFNAINGLTRGPGNRIFGFSQNPQPQLLDVDPVNATASVIAALNPAPPSTPEGDLACDLTTDTVFMTPPDRLSERSVPPAYRCRATRRSSILEPAPPGSARGRG